MLISALIITPSVLFFVATDFTVTCKRMAITIRKVIHDKRYKVIPRGLENALDGIRRRRILIQLRLDVDPIRRRDVLDLGKLRRRVCVGPVPKSMGFPENLLINYVNN